MVAHRLERTQLIPRSRREVFAFFSEAENLERLTPPFLNFKILTPSPILIRQGAHIEYQIGLYGLPMRWLTEITLWEPVDRFVDTQLKGPYRRWEHLHEFRDHDAGTEMRDVVDYELPFTFIGSMAHALVVQRLLTRIFAHRAQVIDEVFSR